MRFVDVKLQCGWPACPTVGSEGEGTVVTRTISLDGRPREIDICKTHGDELDEILSPLLEDGRAVAGPAAKKSSKKAAAPAPAPVGSEDLTCKIDDCGRSFSKTTGLAQHVTRSKDHRTYLNLADYYEDYPPSPTG